MQRLTIALTCERQCGAKRAMWTIDQNASWAKCHARATRHQRRVMRQFPRGAYRLDCSMAAMDNDLGHTAKGWIDEDVEGGGQVGRGDLLAALRGVNFTSAVSCAAAWRSRLPCCALEPDPLRQRGARHLAAKSLSLLPPRETTATART